MPTIDEIIAQMEESAETSRLANIRRQQQAEAIYDEIIARYGPGGTYGRAAEALLERQKIGDVGAGAQRLISAGLYGTEIGGGLERAWEAEVGAPARLRLEDIKMERLSQAQLGKAGFMERIEDVYPDYGMMAQLISQAANVPAAAGGYGGGVAGAVTPTREFGWEGEFGREPYTGEGGFRGAAYTGLEPVTGGVYGPAEERGLEDWLAQGYTGYGPGGEPLAPGGVTAADTAAWQNWESIRKAQREATSPWGYAGPLYPSAAEWKRAAQEGKL